MAEILQWCWDIIIDWIKENPSSFGLMALGVVGLMGTLIETGKRGVLFHFGRARKVLEPGFHLLIPVFQKVKKVHMRDRTMDIYEQRVVSKDGIVYDVDTNLVFRIREPIKVLINIDDMKKGCETVLSLRVQQVFERKTWSEIQQKEAIEEEIKTDLISKFSEWGIEIMRVGFTSITPSPESLALTQLQLLVQNKQKMLHYFQQQQLTTRIGCYLMGTENNLTSHSHLRYQQEAQKKGYGKKKTS